MTALSVGQLSLVNYSGLLVHVILFVINVLAG